MTGEGAWQRGLTGEEVGNPVIKGWWRASSVERTATVAALALQSVDMQMREGGGQSKNTADIHLISSGGGLGRGGRHTHFF